MIGLRVTFEVLVAANTQIQRSCHSPLALVTTITVSTIPVTTIFIITAIVTIITKTPSQKTLRKKHLILAIARIAFILNKTISVISRSLNVNLAAT